MAGSLATGATTAFTAAGIAFGGPAGIVAASVAARAGIVAAAGAGTAGLGGAGDGRGRFSMFSGMNT